MKQLSLAKEANKNFFNGERGEEQVPASR